MFRNSLSLLHQIRNRLTQRAWATSHGTHRFLGIQKDQPDGDFLETFRSCVTKFEKDPPTLNSTDRLSLLTALNQATEAVKKSSTTTFYRRTDRPDDTRSAIKGMSEAIQEAGAVPVTRSFGAVPDPVKPSADMRFVKFNIQRDANAKADIVFQDNKITLVREGGAGQKAGMQPFTGWYIIEVDGNKVGSFVEIMEAFGKSIKPFGKFSLVLSRIAPALMNEHADRVESVPEAAFTNIPSMTTSASDASQKLKEAESAQDQDQIDFWRGYLLVQRVENGEEEINPDF